MQSRSSRYPWTRWARRAAAASGVALAVGASTTWLAFQYIPSWYEPPTLTADDLPRIRATLPAAYQEFTDLLADGGTRQFSLSSTTVNEWIAAREALWPDSRGMLPNRLKNPAVAFIDNRVILAAQFEHDGWRAIVSLHLTVSLETGEIVFRIVKVGAGSLPLPAASMVDAIDAHISAALKRDDELTSILVELTDVDDRLLLKAALAGGVRVWNRLHWSNGERRFRIVDLRTHNGELLLRVESL